jgi:hypothetical protein
LADLRTIFIMAPEGEGSKKFVAISCNEATDFQFDWWIKSWIESGSIFIDDNPEKRGSWTRKERMEILDWMRSTGIVLHEVRGDV